MNTAGTISSYSNDGLEASRKSASRKRYPRKMGLYCSPILLALCWRQNGKAKMRTIQFCSHQPPGSCRRPGGVLVQGCLLQCYLLETTANRSRNSHSPFGEQINHCPSSWRKKNATCSEGAVGTRSADLQKQS